MSSQTQANRTVRFLAVGDVFFDRPAPAAHLPALSELLVTGDVVFGNCEGVYSDSADRAPHARGPQITEPGQAQPLARLGFTVMSVANNHIIDGGHEGLRQTLNLLHSQGIRTVGAASNLAEALKPAVLTTAGPRIAVIAVSSVFPMGYEARIGVPGLAPLRAHTFYLNPTPDEWNPGVLPQVVTAIDDDDSEAIEQAIAEAREVADLVIVSVHWGDVTGRHRLTPHEPQAAELFVQAGADLVLGHHQHTVRGVGFIGRTPIFYGLGHLACDLPRLAEDLARETTELWYADEAAGLNALGSYGIFPRQGYPLLPFHPDARFTVVARCDLDQNGVAEVGMYPCRIEPDGDVIPLAADEDEYLEYLVAGLAAVPDAAEVRPGNDGKWAYWQLLPRS